jgi:hypothetical protein
VLIGHPAYFCTIKREYIPSKYGNRVLKLVSVSVRTQARKMGRAVERHDNLANFQLKILPQAVLMSDVSFNLTGHIFRFKVLCIAKYFNSSWSPVKGKNVLTIT